MYVAVVTSWESICLMVVIYFDEAQAYNNTHE